jgi:hypothetical protein
LQMEKELELTKAPPQGLQENLFHSKEWTTRVEEVVGSCQWIG